MNNLIYVKKLIFTLVFYILISFPCIAQVEDGFFVQLPNGDDAFVIPKSGYLPNCSSQEIPCGKKCCPPSTQCIVDNLNLYSCTKLPNAEPPQNNKPPVKPPQPPLNPPKPPTKPVEDPCPCPYYSAGGLKSCVCGTNPSSAKGNNQNATTPNNYNKPTNSLVPDVNKTNSSWQRTPSLVYWNPSPIITNTNNGQTVQMYCPSNLRCGTGCCSTKPTNAKDYLGCATNNNQKMCSGNSSSNNQVWR